MRLGKEPSKAVLIASVLGGGVDLGFSLIPYSYSIDKRLYDAVLSL